MCPLRYIVFAVSAIVALVVLLWGQSDADDELQKKLIGEGEAAAEGKEGEAAEGVSAPPKTSIVDFFTGKYLYRKWTQYRALQAAQAA
mmetsp:Transcript_451/g.1127  ORF Transcript_451/g.1127 Transcript_451/m.1127 type:complete len:88 (-) Transcript_451:283-546(-)